jgi:hypothetical protein
MNLWAAVAAGDVDAARTLLRQPGVDVAAVEAEDVDAARVDYVEFGVSKNSLAFTKVVVVLHCPGGRSRTSPAFHSENQSAERTLGSGSCPRVHRVLLSECKRQANAG